jgi:hypothetical protein
MISLDDPPSSHGNHEKYFVMKLAGKVSDNNQKTGGPQ